ncbi:MAG: 1-deoxy-D-xylulose-5-phosphate reductoisomerase, partial [Synergistaceae bacterium]|nr:1-deoxy-D-xylulose-5-phosphate reductoisomerase [Synergistaceae bacterium]
PAVLVGADEVAVDLFLKGRIGFTQISGLVESVLESRNWSEPKSLDEGISLVEEGRREALRVSEKF